MTDDEKTVPSGRDMTGLPPILRYGENFADAPPAVRHEQPVPDANGKIKCDICSSMVKASYMQAHNVKQHDVGRVREYKPRALRNGKGKPHHKSAPKSAPKPVVIENPKPSVPADDVPLTVDGILATLVELRWPHTMPTKKVLEMVDLRAALEKFLS